MFTGIRSLLGSGVYTEAYPLHDVGNIMFCYILCAQTSFQFFPIDCSISLS